MKKVAIYADGACKNNGTENAIAGWGAVLVMELSDKDIEKIPDKSLLDGKNYVKKNSGIVDGNQTNNRAEILAAIEGLKMINQPCEVMVYTDSQNLCFTKDIMNRSVTTRNPYDPKKTVFKKSDGTAAENQDLIKVLYELTLRHDFLGFTHVKGHSGDKYNEIADKLASGACAEEIKRRENESKKKNTNNKNEEKPKNNAKENNNASSIEFGIPSRLIAPCPVCGGRPALEEDGEFKFMRCNVCNTKPTSTRNLQDALVAWNKEWLTFANKEVKKNAK